MFDGNFQRRLRMECLEDKRPLAANLAVDVIDGDLFITGDAGDSAFAIDDGDVAGEFLLINRGSFFDTVNGQTFGEINNEYLVSGVTGDFNIDLGGGNDLIRFVEVDLPGSLDLNGGAGDDTFFFGFFEDPDFAAPVSIAGDLDVAGGDGNELLVMRDAEIGGSFSYDGGLGTTNFQIQAGILDIGTPLHEPETVIGGSLTITGGDENDFISPKSLEIGGSLQLNAGAGNDQVDVIDVSFGTLVDVDLGAGSNQIDVENVSGGSSLTVSGTGTNDISVIDVSTSLSVSVLTGSGVDLVSVNNVTTSVGLIATGGENDILELTDSTFDLLAVDLGAGDDLFGTANNDVDLLALLIGGSGEDEYFDFGGNDINWELVFGFEEITEV